MAEISINKSVKEKNNQIAAENRAFFDKHQFITVNMISSPGSGKTSILEMLARKLKKELAVITGDIQTGLDAERLNKSGTQAIQIETQGACHLNADMIRTALNSMDLSGVSILVIENVGNLVCPSTFDLGEHIKMAVLSIPEGDEKPVKYPALFTRAHSVVFNKMDLEPHMNFDIERAENDCRHLNSDVRFFHTSCKTGSGLDELAHYLRDTRKELIEASK